MGRAAALAPAPAAAVILSRGTLTGPRTLWFREQAIGLQNTARNNVGHKRVYGSSLLM